jgi:hypothetical protein
MTLRKRYLSLPLFVTRRQIWIRAIVGLGVRCAVLKQPAFICAAGKADS